MRTYSDYMLPGAASVFELFFTAPCLILSLRCPAVACRCRIGESRLFLLHQFLAASTGGCASDTTKPCRRNVRDRVGLASRSGTAGVGSARCGANGSDGSVLSRQAGRCRGVLAASSDRLPGAARSSSRCGSSALSMSPLPAPTQLTVRRVSHALSPLDVRQTVAVATGSLALLRPAHADSRRLSRLVL